MDMCTRYTIVSTLRRTQISIQESRIKEGVSDQSREMPSSSMNGENFHAKAIDAIPMVPIVKYIS